jgi:hypothetical protein
VARDEQGQIEGTLPLVRVRSVLFGHYLVSLPFLNYGGPLGTTEAVRALAAVAAERAGRDGVKLLELRSRQELALDLPVSHRKITVVLDLPSAGSQALFKSFDSKLRSQVRRPQKEGRGPFRARPGGPFSRCSPLAETWGRRRSLSASSRPSRTLSPTRGLAVPGWVTSRSPAVPASAGAASSR